MRICIMNIHSKKSTETRSTSLANGSPKRQGKTSATAQLADNRPEAAVLLKMQEPANHSPQVSQLRSLQELADSSPQVSRLRALQQLANNSPQVSQLRSLQQLADNSTQAKQATLFQALSDATGPLPTQQKIANGIAQRAQEETEDDELIQAKPQTEQRQPNEPDSKPRPNNTGLPDNLKAGIEALSGMSLDHVKVHYNSDQPAQLNALAYAQGSDIHLAPGQEQHLPHEAWHVVQQAQGQVRPTLQLRNGVPVNDDARLEREADVMGGRAVDEKTLVLAAPRKGELQIHMQDETEGVHPTGPSNATTYAPIQRFYALKDKDNFAWNPTAKTGKVNEKSDMEWIDLPDPRDKNQYPDTHVVPKTGWWLRNLYQRKGPVITDTYAAKFNPEKTVSITPEQFVTLKPGCIAVIKPTAFDRFKAECIASLTEDQAAAITANQAQKMTAEQFKDLEPTRLARLTTDAFAKLSQTNCIAKLTAAQAKAITKQQAGVMTAGQFALLAAGRLANLTNLAFAKLNPEDCIANLTAPQAKAITEDQAGVMTPTQGAQISAVAFPSIKPNTIAKLPAATFAALNPANCIANLTEPQAKAITKDQAQVMTAGQFARLAAGSLANLKEPAFAALDPGNCIANLTASQAAAITQGQAGVMTDKQVYSGIARLEHMGPNSRSIKEVTIRTAVKGYIVAKGGANPPGFQGKSHWGNYVGGASTNRNHTNPPLPGSSGYHSPYLEYDIYPFVANNLRGPWRIVGDTKKNDYYYTRDHYKSFVSI